MRTLPSTIGLSAAAAGISQRRAYELLRDARAEDTGEQAP
jgi:hypothetical protein